MTGKAIILLCFLAYFTGSGFRRSERPIPPVKEYIPIVKPYTTKEQELTKLQHDNDRKDNDILLLAIKISDR